MFTAKLADRMDFGALYMTGYGVSASHLGVADAGLVTYRDMVERARTIAQGISRPLIADADTGFGGLINVRHTVRGYEEAGVQAIQIEDQEMPKKCGHTPGRRVVPMADAVQRIEVAVDARRTDDFLIIARTDARTAHGLDEAIARGRAFAKAGADIIFVESPESVDEFRRIGEALGDCGARLFGFSLAIWPGALMNAVCSAVDGTLKHLLAHGTTQGSPVPTFTMDQLHELVGFPEVWAFEKRWAK
jgi:2-methylisocitrate lyase-like PEP mutase family enzyme